MSMVLTVPTLPSIDVTAGPFRPFACRPTSHFDAVRPFPPYVTSSVAPPTFPTHPWAQPIPARLAASHKLSMVAASPFYLPSIAFSDAQRTMAKLLNITVWYIATKHRYKTRYTYQYCQHIIYCATWGHNNMIKSYSDDRHLVKLLPYFLVRQTRGRLTVETCRYVIISVWQILCQGTAWCIAFYVMYK